MVSFLVGVCWVLGVVLPLFGGFLGCFRIFRSFFKQKVLFQGKPRAVLQ